MPIENYSNLLIFRKRTLDRLNHAMEASGHEYIVFSVSQSEGEGGGGDCRAGIPRGMLASSASLSWLMVQRK